MYSLLATRNNINTLSVLVLLFVSSRAFTLMDPTTRTGKTGTSSFSFPRVIRGGGGSEETSTRLHIFGDALKKAFGNDESLGKAQNAGLTNGPKENDNVTLNGKKVKAVVGQKVSVVAAQNRVKINYNCRNGDCGTCMIKMNGRNVKACQMSIPAGKCNIETL